MVNGEYIGKKRVCKHEKLKITDISGVNSSAGGERRKQYECLVEEFWHTGV